MTSLAIALDKAARSNGNVVSQQILEAEKRLAFQNFVGRNFSQLAKCAKGLKSDRNFYWKAKRIVNKLSKINGVIHNSVYNQQLVGYKKILGI